MSYSGYNSSLPPMSAVPPAQQNPYPGFKSSQSQPSHEQYVHNDTIQHHHGLLSQPQYQHNGCGPPLAQSDGLPLTPPQEPFEPFQHGYELPQQQYQVNGRLSPSSYGPSPSVYSAPSPQQHSAEHGYGSSSPQNSTPASLCPIPTTLNQPRTLHFPQDIGFYTTSWTDLYLSTSQDTPPLHYVSTNTFDSYDNKPSIILHSTASKDSAPLASAKLNQLSSGVDISLSNNPYIFDEKLETEDFFNATDFFTFTLPSSTQRTRFEWKEYSGELVKWLTGEQDGLKLVNADTGNVVAMWTIPQHGSTKKEGKLRFTAENRAFFGERFERMVVISLLAILERKRGKDEISLGYHLGNSQLGGGGA